MNSLKRLALAGIVIIGLTGSVLAQVPPPSGPTISLTVDQQELAVIGKALGALPYAEVATLMVKLQNQVIGQQRKPEAKTEEPKGEKPKAP